MKHFWEESIFKEINPIFDQRQLHSRLDNSHFETGFYLNNHLVKPHFPTLQVGLNWLSRFLWFFYNKWVYLSYDFREIKIGLYKIAVKVKFLEMEVVAMKFAVAYALRDGGKFLKGSLTICCLQNYRLEFISWLNMYPKTPILKQLY